MMGLFGSNKNCAVCGAETFIMGRKTIKDGYICWDCSYGKLGVNFFNMENYTAEECAILIESKKVCNCKFNEIVWFVDDQQKCYVMSDKAHIINYDDIVGYELLDDNGVITSGGLGRAIVGGTLFGDTGAIVGAITGSKKTKNVCTELVIKLIVKNDSCPSVYIKFIENPTMTNSDAYKEKFTAAQDCLSKLQVICEQRREQAVSDRNIVSVADEILKFKQLLDMGAITQEEYDIKKKQLLAL